MKKIITVITLCLTTVLLYAQQEWAPIGAKWHQNIGISDEEQLPGYSLLMDYTIIESTGDTLVSDLQLRKVGDYLTYQDKDKIYLWWGDSLNLIYDFEVEIGDTVTFNLLGCNNSGYGINTLKYEVTDVSWIEVSGQSLKKVAGVLMQSEPFSSSEIYEYTEKIGANTTFIEQQLNCIYIPGYLSPWTRCYTDDAIEFKTEKFLAFGDYDCDYQQLTATEDIENLVFDVSPNPATDNMQISGEGYFDVSFYDLNGRVLFTKNNIFEKTELSLNDYPKGVYFIKIKKGNRMVTKKVIKQ